ncbi:LOW QUALITY PROTEIN: uncharacterized protein LOC116524007 [Thamnophis elegans]|uniref:LOW QUALITY PROTEIN: uncharacterized protein LOC116524007 n=1 Tax=Thamnophis elegans TaxID=35005 RepID=UPI001376F866|nr:LOW QUALITY PROTEIN: uncharacterized protein LOC116524007 [Thamnophis elegans]
MGRDLLCKLRAQIFFDEKGSVGVKYGNVNLEMPKEEAWRIMVVQEVSGDKWREFQVPGLWAEDNPPGFAAHHTPIIVEELPMSPPVCIRQRGYPREIVQAIQEVIQLYLTYKILVPTDSPWNSPILPIPKGEGKYRMAQDLRRVNSSTVTIYPTLPNPYVLLGLIPPEAKWFSVIDLKDAFFSIPIHKKSQHLFAFEWENPTTGRKQQYTWTRLPQEYKNSPTHFSAALATDLEILDLPPPDVVLQYVDDLLVTGQTEGDCHANTEALLLLLQEKGYKASRAKAQLVQLNVRYLGYDIQQGQRTLGHERKEAICQLPAPRNRKELRGFLGAAGFCRIWIPNFALLAKPLYEATKGNEKEPLRWEKEEQKSFLNLKHALTQAPSLGLPNLDKPFHLFVDTKQNMAVGVLTQKMGTWYRPVAYLSKQLDQVAKGWPSCLKAVAGTALLTQEANKLTFGQQLNIYTPHALRAVLDQKGHLWLTNPRMLKYQGLITHNPLIKLVQSYALNPATLLPEPDSEISHDCLQTIEETYASRPDLKDEPFSDPDATFFTDGTSFIHEGVRKAAYAIVTLDDVWEAKPLPAGTSAQLAELHALTRALELAKGLRVNIYTDSKYAFLTVQVHGALYKERGLITAGGKDIKYGPQILRLLDSVWAPKQVAIMHVRGHQKGISTAERGNHKADQVARAAALDPFSLQANCLTLWIPNQEDEPPSYSHSEVQQAEAIGAELVNGWWTLPDNRVFVPQQTLSSLYTLPKGEDEGRTPPRLLIHGKQSLYGQVVKTPLQVSLQVLGIPVYDSVDPIRQKREVNTAFSNFPCKELTEYEKSDTWSSERIVCTYGRATWAEDGSWGYRTPIYMINRIMRLQAVLDLAGERIDKSLNILSTAMDKLRTAVYQNRLALDYLLAREGGVCGKFNLSNCCLQIDETGSVIKQLTTEMGQLTHFPGQEWKGLNLASYFSSWLSKLPGWQAIITFIGLIAAGCIIIPCIMPLFVRAISSTLSLLVEKRATAKVLTLMGHTGEEHEYVGLIGNREPDTYETPQ